MPRFLCGLLLATPLLFAAPVPKGTEKPEDKLRRLFGEHYRC